jgi:Domain of unknown function (DUF4281)
MFQSASTKAVPTPGGLAWMGIKQDNDQLFDILLIKSPMVLIAWALLAFFPRWKHTQPIAQGIGLVFAVLYVLLFVDGIYNPIDFAKITNGKYKDVFSLFYSLEGVHYLFSQRSACFGGWVHYVVFDLWAGVWITQNSVERNIPQILLIPCLFFTMMLGPSGLLLYFILAFLWTKAVKLLGGKDKKV